MILFIEGTAIIAAGLAALYVLTDVCEKLIDKLERWTDERIEREIQRELQAERKRSARIK